MTSIEKIIKKAESLGWDVTINGNEFSLQQFSPAGQDFNIEITADNAEDFIKELKNRYDGFDVSYETYLWLDNEGHGINGAPYDMKDLYEDMEECEEMIKYLWVEIEEECIQ